MENDNSEYTYKANDTEALEQLKILFEFTTPTSVRKSLQITLFTYLKEQAETGQDVTFKQVIQDYFYLIDFLDRLDSE